MAGIINRVAELAALERWWSGGGPVAAIWGRRRVGKTTLTTHFAAGKTAVFHAGAGRGELGELEVLTERVTRALPRGRGPSPPSADRRYRSWAEALQDLQDRARAEPVLLVLDNFAALLESSPELAVALRNLAQKPQAAAGAGRVRVLLSSGSMRQLELLQRAGQPLDGVASTTLVVQPFTPRQAAAMLDQLTPVERARVYGIVGGMPLYLSWWDQDVGIEDNLARLVCQPGAQLLTEGDLLLATDLDDLGFNDRVLHALASGHTSYNDVRDWAGTEPARPLDRLIELRLIERVLPVGENRQARRRRYRIVDPFVRFHLGVVSRYRPDIDRGAVDGLAATLLAEADRSMPEVWVDAFRLHLQELAETGQLPIEGDFVGIGPWWDNTGRAEIDALALVGEKAAPALAGAVTWEPEARADELLQPLKRKVERGVGAYPDHLHYVVCARSRVHDVPYDVMALTAEDLFSADQSGP